MRPGSASQQHGKSGVGGSGRTSTVQPTKRDLGRLPLETDGIKEIALNECHMDRGGWEPQSRERLPHGGPLQRRAPHGQGAPRPCAPEGTGHSRSTANPRGLRPQCGSGRLAHKSCSEDPSVPNAVLHVVVLTGHCWAGGESVRTARPHPRPPHEQARRMARRRGRAVNYKGAVLVQPLR